MKQATLMRAAIFSLMMLLASVSYAAKPGFYAGAGAGLSQLATPNQSLFDPYASNDTNSKKLRGFSGRAYAGYRFNQYLGFEAGIARYASAKYTANLANANSSLSYSMNAVDVVAKTYLPIGEDRFNLYALGGVAAVNQSQQFHDGGIPFVSNFLAPQTGTKAHHKIRPIYGVGIGYDIPKSHFTANIEMTRIQGIGEMRTNLNAMPSANMVSFNLTYNFS